jgi:DNA modification methylase
MTARLINGECIEQMKLLPDKSVDLFVCDLPYGQLNPERVRDTSKWWDGAGQARGCAWDVKIDLAAFWEQVERLSKSDHTPVLHFCNTKFGIELINSKPSWFRYDLVWNKERGVSFLMANKQPMRSHEMIYVFSKKGANYNRVNIKTDKSSWAVTGKRQVSSHYGAQRINTEGGNDGMRCALSIINVPTHVGRNRHPTEKPVDLYKWLIERYSNEGDTVMDPTAGSFNSIRAAIELGRNGTGIERNVEFFNVAVAKFQPRNEIIPPTSQSPEE